VFAHHMQRGPRLRTFAGFLGKCESLSRPVALYGHAESLSIDVKWSVVTCLS
jgi:hypothetical protein